MSFDRNLNPQIIKERSNSRSLSGGRNPGLNPGYVGATPDYYIGMHKAPNLLQQMGYGNNERNERKERKERLYPEVRETGHGTGINRDIRGDNRDLREVGVVNDNYNKSIKPNNYVNVNANSNVNNIPEGKI